MVSTVFNALGSPWRRSSVTVSTVPVEGIQVMLKGVPTLMLEGIGSMLKGFWAAVRVARAARTKVERYISS
jgi:hypothetical protein